MLFNRSIQLQLTKLKYQTYFQDDVFVLDLIAGSPGTIFCYFAILNYAQGLQGR